VADLSDEVLMAYADGVLDEALRAHVEQELQQHPEYRQKVEKFRATLKPVQEVFEEKLDERRLAGMAAWIGREASRRAADPPDKPQVVALSGARLRMPLATSRSNWPAKLAASIALLAGGALGWLMHGSAGREASFSPALVTFGDGSLRAGADLAKLLETVGSGGKVVTADGHGRAWELKAISSFRALDGSLCRRYELALDAAARFGGYACRDAEAQWLVQAHARLNNKMPDRPGFAPASGGNADALDAGIRAAMDGDVLEASQEARLIANRWATKSN
jgi:hypothetical protein